MDGAAFQQDMRLRTVPNVLAYAASIHGDRPFLREAGSSDWLTFAEAARRSQMLALGLAQIGIGAGDYVPVMLPNGIGFALSWFALNLQGAAYLGINTSMVGDLLAKQFALGRARVWLVHAEYLPVVTALPDSLRATVATLIVAGLPPGSEPEHAR